MVPILNRKIIKSIVEVICVAGICIAGIVSGIEQPVLPAQAEVKTEEKKIALTFDDGPSAAYTEILLDGLRERGVKASFFLIGEQAERYPEIVKRIDQEGHLIGNHTYHHVELTKINREKEKEEIETTTVLLEQITGKQISFIRPPFGAWRKENMEEVELLPVLWDIDPLDWCSRNTGEIVRRVVTHAKENGIILLHDCYRSSVEAALQIIDILKEQGYQFVTVDELLMN